MNIFPMLFTERLMLRKIEVDDIPALVKYANNKKISDNIINIPYPYREPDAAFRISFVVQGFKKKTRVVFAIISKEHNELIGEISLHIMDLKNRQGQLAYWIGEPFWNKGMTTEAAKAVIRFGFEQLNLNLIYADCYTENIGSQKVIEKNGMKYHSKNGNILLYKITKEEYEAE